MNSQDVIALYAGLEAIGIGVWLDGGWGVDALLGRQTRPHGDVDIVIQQKDVAGMRAFLARQGYTDLPRPDTRAWNFVLADPEGRQVDVHVIVFDADGNAIYGPREDGLMWRAGELDATGTIDGVVVRCTTPQSQLQSHTGYTRRPVDIADVTALCEKFKLPLPLGYMSDRK